MKSGEILLSSIYSPYGNYIERVRLDSSDLHPWNVIASSNHRPWIQADIGYQTCVSGVITQGDGLTIDDDWITSISVSTFLTTNGVETFVLEVRIQLILSRG